MISEFYALYWFRLQLIEFLRLRLDRVIAKISKDVVNCMDFLRKYFFTFTRPQGINVFVRGIFE